MTSESSALQHAGESLCDVTDVQEGLVIAPDGKDPARPHHTAAGGGRLSQGQRLLKKITLKLYITPNI